MKLTKRADGFTLALNADEAFELQKVLAAMMHAVIRYPHTLLPGDTIAGTAPSPLPLVTNIRPLGRTALTLTLEHVRT